MDGDRLPISYQDCRAAFRGVATAAGATLDTYAIDARGPGGDELTIDVATVGHDRLQQVLVVLSGVHGVEAPVNSALQVELLERLGSSPPPDGVGVVLVHVVNPWGMAHHRRQNESNVDLNRNWRRSDREPEPNDGYELVHALVCPDTPGMPEPGDALRALGPLADERGVAWVADAITRGQYAHPDGLHFGGHRTESSCRILERELARRLRDAVRVITIDLHTGVGAYGRMTLLTNHSAGSPEADVVSLTFGSLAETGATIEWRPGGKPGAIAAGVADLAPGAACVAVTAEFGTASDLEQLAATYQEQWVHRHGDPNDPAHAAARERYRRCFTPDDPAWASQALTAGRDLLDRAVATLRQ